MCLFYVSKVRLSTLMPRSSQLYYHFCLLNYLFQSFVHDLETFIVFILYNLGNY